MSKYEYALDLLIEWISECDFDYDNIPNLYEKYKEDIEDMGLCFCDGLKYISLKEGEKYENC